MSRFIEVENRLINTGKIVGVIKESSSLSIILENDERIDIDRRMIKNLDRLYKEIKGNSHIVNVIQPPETLYAVYDMEDEEGNQVYEANEVKLLGILQDGRIEAIELCEGYYDVCSECANYMGIYTRDQIKYKFSNYRM